MTQRMVYSQAKKSSREYVLYREPGPGGATHCSVNEGSTALGEDALSLGGHAYDSSMVVMKRWCNVQ